MLNSGAASSADLAYGETAAALMLTWRNYRPCWVLSCSGGSEGFLLRWKLLCDSLACGETTEASDVEPWRLPYLLNLDCSAGSEGFLFNWKLLCVLV